MRHEKKGCEILIRRPDLHTALSLNISDLPLFPHFARLLLFILGLLNLLCVTVTKLDSNTDLEYAVA